MKIRKILLLLIFCSTFANSHASDVNEEKFNESIKMLLDEKNIDASKLKAIEKLEKLGDPKAVPYLMDAIRTKNFPYYFAAIHALAILGSGIDTINFLESLLVELKNEKRDELDREQHTNISSKEAFIVGALYKLGNKEHVEILFETIMSDNKIIRYNAAVALGMVNSKWSKKCLYYLLRNDPMALVRSGAAAALVELGEPEPRDVVMGDNPIFSCQEKNEQVVKLIIRDVVDYVE